MLLRVRASTEATVLGRDGEVAAGAFAFGADAVNGLDAGEIDLAQIGVADGAEEGGTGEFFPRRLAEGGIHRIFHGMK